MDNIFIERLWRRLKYACIYYLNAFETGSEAARAGIGPGGCATTMPRGPIRPSAGKHRTRPMPGPS